MHFKHVVDIIECPTALEQAIDESQVIHVKKPSEVDKSSVKDSSKSDQIQNWPRKRCTVNIKENK